MRYVGTKEVTPNRSPLIDFWERRFGLRGQNWCMIFAWTMEDMAADAYGYKNPLLKTGLCCEQLRYANRIGVPLRVVRPRIGNSSPKIKAGSLGFTSSQGVRAELIGKQWSGHVFRVTHDAEESVYTVEGNFRNSVACNIRRKSKILAFVEAR